VATIPCRFFTTVWRPNHLLPEWLQDFSNATNVLCTVVTIYFCYVNSFLNTIHGGNYKSRTLPMVSVRLLAALDCKPHMIIGYLRPGP